MTTIVARSRPCSLVIQPCQLPASSLTSAICLSPANPSNGNSATTTTRRRGRCILIVHLLSLTDERARRFGFLPKEDVLRFAAESSRITITPQKWYNGVGWLGYEENS